MNPAKRVLVCPLDWGLGHATRCIPIIRLLIEKNAEVIIAGDGPAMELLKQEFPQLNHIYLKGYGISYSTKLNMAVKMFFSIPKIIFRIITEHYQLRKIVKAYKIDVVISDNRYGLWNTNVKSIFITHQLMIKSPVAEGLLHRLVVFFVKKYDECWVPDVEGANNLSGDLSHKYPLLPNARFIGVLSRFENEYTLSLKDYYDVIAIISGPEPQRSEFEKTITAQLQRTSVKALLVKGKPHVAYTEESAGNVNIVSHLNSKKLQEAIQQSTIVIARSGYSTIMDLAVLNKKAIFIPTPGQTEQEYLADRLMKRKIAFSQTQEQIDIQHALTEAKKYDDFISSFPSLKLEINKLLSAALRHND